MRCLRHASWLLLAAIALPCGLQAQLTVDFNANDAGWTIIDFNWPSGPYNTPVGGPFAPVFSAAGGNPGGFISATDRPSNPVSYFYAPASFRSALAGAYGSTVQFDLETPTSGTFFTQPDIVMTGGGLTLLLNISGLQTAPTSFWSTYSFTLSQAGWTLQGGGTPNALQFQSVLGALTAFSIRGEFYDTVSASLDNVRVSGIPEASETILFALGLALLLVSRRGRRAIGW